MEQIRIKSWRISHSLARLFFLSLEEMFRDPSEQWIQILEKLKTKLKLTDFFEWILFVIESAKTIICLAIWKYEQPHKTRQPMKSIVHCSNIVGIFGYSICWRNHRPSQNSIQILYWLNFHCHSKTDAQCDDRIRCSFISFRILTWMMEKTKVSHPAFEHW